MMRTEQPIVMLHENDMANGGCEFSRFFSTTPQDLIVDGLYKALALAYYPGHFRPVSVALVAKKLAPTASRQRRLRSIHRAVSQSKIEVALASGKASSSTELASDPDDLLTTV